MKKLIYFFLFCFLPLYSQTYNPSWKSLDTRPVPSWFTNAKFGIFIHWGVYSVPAYRPLGTERFASYAEWYQVDVMNKPGKGRDFHDRVYGKDFQYREFAPMFKAELFNPDDWAELFKKSGARYVVLTSKHHDGYCLWPTKSPFSKDWNSMDTGPKRDLVEELTKSVRSKGLKMGLYYSLLEWETPTPAKETNPYLPSEIIQKYRIPSSQYINGHIIPQLKELVNTYQPAVIFSDGAWDETSAFWNSESFLAWLYNEAPNKDEVLVNDRWGKDAHGSHGDFSSSEYSAEDETMTTSRPWEESQGIGGSYGFNRAESIEDYKSSKQIIHLLIKKVSKGGNLLLNVGPSSDGLIPVIMQQRLMDIGRWLNVNGEAIYDTQPWYNHSHEIKNENIFFTKNGDTVYAICTKWPDKSIVLPGLKKNAKVTLLGSDIKVKVRYSKDMLSISPPLVSPGNMPCEHAWVFKIN